MENPHPSVRKENEIKRLQLFLYGPDSANHLAISQKAQHFCFNSRASAQFWIGKWFFTLKESKLIFIRNV